MRVCKIWDADYPWDVRVEKICNSFVEKGHEVHLVCRNRAKRPLYETDNGIHIHRLPKITAALGGVLSFPFFLNPVWLVSIARIVIRYDVDIIVVRDLPMALAGVFIGKITGKPCFLDMAEPYPEMLQGYEKMLRVSQKQKLVNKVVRNSDFAYVVEKAACRYMTHIFPVSDEIRDNLIRKGIDKSRISVLHNTPRLMTTVSGEVVYDNIAEEGNTIRIIYVGDLTEARGIPIVIEALAELIKMGESFKLIIVGSGRYEEKLKSIVNERELDDHVFFTGWIDNKKLNQYLKAGDIGVIPHIKTSHNDLTLPNKVFDYMSMRIPIVSADLVPVKRIIEETNSGVIFKEYKADYLVEALMQLKDKGKRLQLGENGKRYYEQKYNWENDFKCFIATIENYLKRKKYQDQQLLKSDSNRSRNQ